MANADPTPIIDSPLNSPIAPQISTPAAIGNWDASLSNTSVTSTQRMLDGASKKSDSVTNVYGAAVNSALPFGFTVEANLALDGSAISTSADLRRLWSGTQSWNALLGYQWGALNVKAGYREIDDGFVGPFAWGSSSLGLGIDNIQGTEVLGSYSIASNMSLFAGGLFAQGMNNSGQMSVLGVSDRVNTANVGFNYGLGKSSSLDLGYEWVQWDLNRVDQTGAFLNGKPSEQYITIGLGHNLNKNAAVKLLYQVSDYNASNSLSNSSEPQETTGDRVVGQATIKF